MMTFEDFKRSNLGFGYYGQPTEKEMQECYEIAQQVERTYQETYGHIDGPRIGDIVEFSAGYEVNKYGKIVENMYGGSKYGMLCVCANGSSFTNGRGFDTSGGPFYAFHKSKLQLVGEDENIVWTWGCHGSGAHQGIYFTLKVRRWIIPYGPDMKRSEVVIRGRGAKGGKMAVSISNFGEFFNAQSFVSIGAFMAWAEYVGYRYQTECRGTFRGVSTQRICDKCYTDPTWQPPVGAKPIKLVRNGDLKDAWVVTTDECIMYYWPNIHDPNRKEPAIGTPEYEEKFREYRKYSDNPMGIELKGENYGKTD